MLENERSSDWRIWKQDRRNADGFVITNKNLAKTEVPAEKKWLGKAVNEIEVKNFSEWKEVNS